MPKKLWEPSKELIKNSIYLLMRNLFQNIINIIFQEIIKSY